MSNFINFKQILSSYGIFVPVQDFEPLPMAEMADVLKQDNVVQYSEPNFHNTGTSNKSYNIMQIDLRLINLRLMYKPWGML